MRFLPASFLFLLIVTPVSAHARERWVGTDHEAQSQACASQADPARAPAKSGLLANNTTAQLIERGSALALNISPSLNGSSKDRETAVELEHRCQSSLPPPDGKTTSFVAMTAGLRLAAIPPRMPLIAGRLSSGFGLRVHPLLARVRMHSGVDLAAPLGSPIFATDSGRISSAGSRGGYGLVATIEHPSGLQTLYGHMSRLNVVAGQRVEMGQIIGFVGSTGLSTGPHIHYEVRFRGQAINPLSLTAPLSNTQGQRKAR